MAHIAGPYQLHTAYQCGQRTQQAPQAAIDRGAHQSQAKQNYGQAVEQHAAGKIALLLHGEAQAQNA